MEERDRRRDELRRSLGIEPARRPRRRQRRGLLGGGSPPVYIAVFVAVSGFTIYTAITAFADGHYLDGAARAVISVAMLGLLYYVIRSRM